MFYICSKQLKINKIFKNFLKFYKIFLIIFEKFLWIYVQILYKFSKIFKSLRSNFLLDVPAPTPPTEILADPPDRYDI